MVEQSLFVPTETPITIYNKPRAKLHKIDLALELVNSELDQPLRMSLYLYFKNGETREEFGKAFTHLATYAINKENIRYCRVYLGLHLLNDLVPLLDHLTANLGVPADLTNALKTPLFFRDLTEMEQSFYKDLAKLGAERDAKSSNEDLRVQITRLQKGAQQIDTTFNVNFLNDFGYECEEMGSVSIAGPIIIEALRKSFSGAPNHVLELINTYLKSMSLFGFKHAPDKIDRESFEGSDEEYQSYLENQVYFSHISSATCALAQRCHGIGQDTFAGDVLKTAMDPEHDALSESMRWLRIQLLLVGCDNSQTPENRNKRRDLLIELSESDHPEAEALHRQLMELHLGVSMEAMQKRFPRFPNNWGLDKIFTKLEEHYGIKSPT